MLSNEIVNIIIQSSDGTDVERTGKLVDNIMHSLPELLGLSEIQITSIEPNDFTQSLRDTPLDSRGKIIINIINDLESDVNVTSHSNRYHTLDTYEKCGIGKITNLQFILEQPAKFYSFSTGDNESAQIIVRQLINIYNIFNNVQDYVPIVQPTAIKSEQIAGESQTIITRRNRRTKPKATREVNDGQLELTL